MVSTANMAPPENTGGAWQFNGPPPLASIVNFGQIKIGHGGDCFFIADKVENHGSVEAPGGNISFAAGQTVTLSERPDGRGMSMQVTLPQGSVDNYGNVIADGGTIALNAKVVNQNGFIQANSVQNNSGVIELVASDTLNLGVSSTISAKGDDSAAGSAGGTVTLKSDNVFSDATGSQIVTTGGANGGNGAMWRSARPTSSRSIPAWMPVRRPVMSAVNFCSTRPTSYLARAAARSGERHRALQYPGHIESERGDRRLVRKQEFFQHQAAGHGQYHDGCRRRLGFERQHGQ